MRKQTNAGPVHIGWLVGDRFVRPQIIPDNTHVRSTYVPIAMDKQTDDRSQMRERERERGPNWRYKSRVKRQPCTVCVWERERERVAGRCALWAMACRHAWSMHARDTQRELWIPSYRSCERQKTGQWEKMHGKQWWRGELDRIIRPSCIYPHLARAPLLKALPATNPRARDSIITVLQGLPLHAECTIASRMS